MIIWLTIQIFQSMFGIKIDNESLGFLHVLGFTELLIEITGVLYLIGVFIYLLTQSIEGTNSNNKGE